MIFGKLNVKEESPARIAKMLISWYFNIYGHKMEIKFLRKNWSEMLLNGNKKKLSPVIQASKSLFLFFRFFFQKQVYHIISGASIGGDNDCFI